jgi:preprotein translocase subunit SecG
MLPVLLTIVYVVVSLFLILVVLLQTGKRADLAGAFGGGGSQTAFGARGAATVLAKATTIAAVLFMITALALSIVHSRRAGLGTSVLDDADPAVTAPPPEVDPGADGLAVPPADEPPMSDPATSVPPTDDAGAPLPEGDASGDAGTEEP